MFLKNFRRFNSNCFVFPQRVVRSPTAILEALNGCVEISGQNPGYQYTDDPFLIPTSSYEKRQFSLSKSAGRKAARWIIDRYPSAFYQDVAVPSIPSFFPSFSFEEKDFLDVDENTIYKLISWNQLTKAFEIYKKILVEQIEISVGCKLALFDLLCFYNSENPSEFIGPEENFFHREQNEENIPNKKTWKENGPAEVMFEHLKKTSNDDEKFRVYNSFVSGLLKFNEIQKALKTIDEMKNEKIRLDLTSYNYLLSSASLIKESAEGRVKFLLETLKEIKENGLTANLRSFNAIFRSLSRNGPIENGPTLSLSILNEMKKLKINPSLGTWSNLILIFYPNEKLGVETKIFPKILDEIENEFRKNGNRLEWRDIDDGDFFPNAMFKATVNCRDVDLAKRIFKIFTASTNSRFVVDAFKEQMFYTNFFRLLFRVDLPENVLPIWESIVPNVFSPSVNVVEDFIEFLNLWNLKNHFVRLWSDLLTLGIVDNRQNSRRVLERYLTLLNQSDQQNFDETTIQQYANIARQIIKRFPLNSENQTDPIDEQKYNNRSTTNQFQYTGHLLSHLICLLSQDKDLQPSWILFEHYLANRSTLINPLTERCLMSLLSLAVKEKQIQQSFTILQTINELAYDCLGDALDLVNRNISLTHQDRLQLRAIQKNATVESAHQVKLI